MGIKKYEDFIVSERKEIKLRKQVRKLEEKIPRQIKSDKKSDRKIADDVNTEGKLLNVKNLLNLDDKMKTTEENDTRNVKKIVDRLEKLRKGNYKENAVHNVRGESKEENLKKNEENCLGKFKFKNCEEKRKCRQEEVTKIKTQGFTPTLDN